MELVGVWVVRTAVSIRRDRERRDDCRFFFCIACLYETLVCCRCFSREGSIKSRRINYLPFIPSWLIDLQLKIFALFDQHVEICASTNVRFWLLANFIVLCTKEDKDGAFVGVKTNLSALTTLSDRIYLRANVTVQKARKIVVLSKRDILLQ